MWFTDEHGAALMVGLAFFKEKNLRVFFPKWNGSVDGPD